MQARNLIVALVLGIAIAAGLALALRNAGGPAAPLTATILPAGNALPDFALLDQDGAAVDRTVFAGQWDVVFFGFTHCPDICPATMTVLGQESMAQYIGYFGEGNLGLTGELEEIRKLTDALGIYFQKAATEDANYGVDHSTVVLVIDPQSRLKALFSAPHKVENLVHDLPLIMASE